jgi:hypothetical protein
VTTRDQGGWQHCNLAAGRPGMISGKAEAAMELCPPAGRHQPRDLRQFMLPAHELVSETGRLGGADWWPTAAE